ncbi:hypothetical protein CSUI_006319, partial [Cystoisospora suis]
KRKKRKTKEREGEVSSENVYQRAAHCAFVWRSRNPPYRKELTAHLPTS